MLWANVTSAHNFFQFSEGTFSQQLFELTKFHLAKFFIKNRFGDQIGVGPGSVTERWPFQKSARKSAFFRKKIKINLKKMVFFAYIF